MRKRGVEDFSLAMIDPWAAGYTGEEDAATARRILRPLTWVRSEPGEHGYARPIEGLVVEFDLDAMAVVAVHDYGVVPLPPKSGNYDPARMADPDNVPRFPRPRTDLKPIEITQPEGPSASPSRATSCAGRSGSCGSASRRARASSCTTSATRTAARCGRSSTARRWRRCSCPTATRRRRTASRTSSTWASTASAGSPTRSQLGCDCLGEIRYFDGVVNDQDGEPMTIPNAICMHEEDAGVGWKHTDFRTEDVEVRRLRRLVISSIATVGNYEYGYFWYLYTDGTIEYEVKLTGVISTGALRRRRAARARHAGRPRALRAAPPALLLRAAGHGRRRQRELGRAGRLRARAARPGEPAWARPGGPSAPSTAPRREAQAQIDPLRAATGGSRTPRKSQSSATRSAYKLVPGENVAPMFAPESRFAQRAGFTRNHVWVTAYDPEQRFAAGDYPYQHSGGDGLPRFAAADRPTEDTDVVLWYTFGAHHIARPEDWPVMPVTHIGFKLKPSGFFDGNPALDMPAPATHCHHEE